MKILFLLLLLVNIEFSYSDTSSTIILQELNNPVLAICPKCGKEGSWIKSITRDKNSIWYFHCFYCGYSLKIINK